MSVEFNEELHKALIQKGFKTITFRYTGKTINLIPTKEPKLTEDSEYEGLVHYDISDEVVGFLANKPLVEGRVVIDRSFLDS